MTNAREELLSHLRHTTGDIVCAKITHGDPYDEDSKVIILQIDHSEEEFAKFLNELDFTYDSGYGLQHVHGKVWLSDGSWLERYEYDGSECWTLKVHPSIPWECIK